MYKFYCAENGFPKQEKMIFDQKGMWNLKKYDVGFVIN